MKKYIIFSIIGLIVLIGVLGGIKGLQINRMIAQGEQYVPPPETVTAAVVKPATWPSVHGGGFARGGPGRDGHRRTDRQGGQDCF
jgi:hypothetical protein